MVALGLMATLAVVQPQPASRPLAPSETPAPSEITTPAKNQPLTLLCTKDDRKGNCTAGAGVDGKAIMVVGEGMTQGATMTCVSKIHAVACEPMQ
jgi:hypothetical protein